MITSFMTTQEILTEFWKDYETVIVPRLMGWIRGHSKLVKRKDFDWVELKEIRPVKINGNVYKNSIKAKIQKNGHPAFIATSYIIVTDSDTGREFVHLLPKEKYQKSLITFDSHFFYRWESLFLKSTNRFSDIVDAFMKTTIEFSLKTTSDWKDYDLNFQVDLGNDRIGIGHCNLDEMSFFVKTCLKKEIIEVWREELGLPKTESYLNIYIAHKEARKNSIIEEQLSDKEKEIRQAWEEYEQLKREGKI